MCSCFSSLMHGPFDPVLAVFLGSAVELEVPRPQMWAECWRAGLHTLKFNQFATAGKNLWLQAEDCFLNDGVSSGNPKTLVVYKSWQEGPSTHLSGASEKTQTIHFRMTFWAAFMNRLIQCTSRGYATKPCLAFFITNPWENIKTS